MNILVFDNVRPGDAHCRGVCPPDSRARDVKTGCRFRSVLRLKDRRVVPLDWAVQCRVRVFAIIFAFASEMDGKHAAAGFCIVDQCIVGSSSVGTTIGSIHPTIRDVHCAYGPSYMYG